MKAAQKKQIRAHWQHVQEASGQPFNDALLMQENFVYDTEPACRAVVTARSMQQTDVLAFMQAISTAFYRDARDITNVEIPGDIAAEKGIDRADFSEALKSDGMRDAVKRDFSFSQSHGIQGFPTLCAGRSEQLQVITNGYASVETIEAGFKHLRGETA